MKALLGEEYDAYLASFDEERFYGLRVNTLKLSAEEMACLLYTALQCATGFTIAFFVYQIGTLITTGSLGNGFIPGLIVVILIAAFIAHLIVKANKSIAKEYALGNNMSNSAKSA